MYAHLKKNTKCSEIDMKLVFRFSKEKGDIKILHDILNVILNILQTRSCKDRAST